MNNNTQGLLHLIGTWRAEWLKDVTPSRASFSRKPLIISAIAILGLLWFASTASAVTNTWIGATSTDWNTGTNWSTGLVPTATDDVIVPSGGVTNEPTISATDVTVDGISVQAGRTLTVNKSLTIMEVNADSNNSGTIVINGMVTFTTTMQGNGFHNAVTGIISGTGSFRALGGDPPFHLANIYNGGTFDVPLTISGTVATGGARVFNGTFGKQIAVDSGATLRIGGGQTVVANDNITVNGVIDDEGGTLTFNGATFTNNGAVKLQNTNFNRTGAQTIVGSGTWTGNGNNGNITIAASSNVSLANAVSFTLPDTLTVNGTLTVNNPLTISRSGFGPHVTNNGMISISSTLTYITDNQNNGFVNSSGAVISGSGLFQAQGSDPPFHLANIDNRGTFDVALKVSGSVATGGARVFNSVNNTTVFGQPITVDSGATLRIGSGQTVVANDNVTVNGTLDDEISTLTFNAVTFTNNGAVKLSKLNFNRTGAQTIAGTGTWTTSGNNTCDISVDISSNTMLANSIILPSSGTLTVRGTLDQGSSSDLAAGPINITSGGFLRAHGTSSLTLAGDVTNNGQMSINGGTGACGEPDIILIRSSVAGTPRTWSGSGTFALIDVDVKDQTAGNPPGTINVASGTDSGNNTNWVFGGCNIATAAPATISGHIIDGDGNPVEGAAIRMNGTQNRITITDRNGDYHFDSVETNGFYTLKPVRANFSFSPAQRSFSILGPHTDEVFKASYNGGTENPLDTTEYFVRQQYLDFLNREPEEAGFTSWVNGINLCAAGDQSCDRVHASEMFFRSAEFQQRGYFAYRFYAAALGRKPDYAEFAPDLKRLSGFLTDDQLAAARTAFVNDFMTRPQFVARYNSLNNLEYVDALISTARVNQSDRQSLSDGLNSGTQTRAQVLRQIAESAEVYERNYNQAFVVMEYFGYLERDPDALYLNWIVVLDQTGDPRHMVEGFVNSLEYRDRFAR